MAPIKTKKISELKVGDNLEYVDGEVVEVGEQRDFGVGQHLQPVTIADETGAIVKFTLFDKPEHEMDVGDKVRFHNCFIKDFNGTLNLNLKKTADSTYEIVDKGDGKTKIKPKTPAGSSTFNAVLGARQTAVQVAGRVLAQSSTSVEDLLKFAEKVEEWLNRP